MGDEAYGGSIREIFQCKDKAGQAEGNISATLQQSRAKWIYGGGHCFYYSLFEGVPTTSSDRDNLLL